MKRTKILAIVLTGLLTLLVFSTGYSIALNDTVLDQTSTSDEDYSSNATIPYLGNLSDEAGNPVADGIYGFNFFLYEDQNKVELLWSEEQQEVEVESGVFTVQLGSVQSLPAQALQSDQLYLQIAVSASGDETYTTLNPPQVIQPVSASDTLSTNAQAACAHDHLGEVWTGGDGLEIVKTSSGGSAIHAISTEGSPAIIASAIGNGIGVVAESDYYYGVYGQSIYSTGVFAQSSYGNGGYFQSGTGHGVYGLTYGNWSYHSGVYGEAQQDNANGVTGWNTAAGPGVYGYSESGYAGYFAGTVNITGNLSKGGGGFKIDHPLDPENQYLNHSFVESPDMKNVYDGVVVLDANGEAWVELPAYFETLNKDFRYQLTAIGAPAPGLYVAQEIEDNRFQIAGGLPGLKVSWQVTGIRHDPYAEAHPILVEEDKDELERGKYLHPVELGQPAILGLDTAQNQRPANEEGQ